jgi:hypothetical protein
MQWHGRTEIRRRPWWMNLLLGFCVDMKFISLPFDTFIKPVAVDAEVWVGVARRGRALEIHRTAAWGDLCRGSLGILEGAFAMWP